MHSKKLRPRCIQTKRYLKKKTEFDASESRRASDLLAARLKMKQVDVEDGNLTLRRAVLGKWLAWAEHELKVRSPYRG